MIKVYRVCVRLRARQEAFSDGASSTVAFASPAKNSCTGLKKMEQDMRVFYYT